ncbi:MAG: hypothetical protein HY400_02420 [Elusimicrobia bacterium]|nr:hypothetical protein [Elusimicrobiota bacterium]
MPSRANLSPGIHSYAAVMDAIREGMYRFARIRTASGRLHHLIGISPQQFKILRREARQYKVGFILLGSRVSGPRIRQKELNPVLKQALPLQALKRTPSPTYPGAEGVVIDKTAIKELGSENIHTSDLSIILVDPVRRSSEELFEVAKGLEIRFRQLGCSFPVRVFSQLEERCFYSERDFVGFGRDYLKRLLSKGHPFSDADVEQAFGELYAPLNLTPRLFGIRDLAAGVWNAFLAGVSFSLALKFHPVILAVGFGFGLMGRYMARLKAWVATAWGDTFVSNAGALLADASVGFCVMAGVINPVASLGIGLEKIAWTSLLHTLSKGSLRLFLDKIYSVDVERRQAEGVIVASSLNFLQGLATAYIYAGNSWAVYCQFFLTGLGLYLVFQNPIQRILIKEGSYEESRAVQV